MMNKQKKMNWLSTTELVNIAANPTHQTKLLAISKLDFTRPFIPEQFTQLYYTPIYQQLTSPQKLRYNQLFAVRTNEYIMMLESDLVDHFLVPLRKNISIRNDQELVVCLENMIKEERLHYQGFLALNRLCLPDTFKDGRERYFSELSVQNKFAMYLLELLAHKLTFPLWYIMALEESSISLAQSMLRTPETKNLGKLEPQFASVHKEHMKDETRHLHTDRLMIEASLSKTNRLSSWINARLFKFMLKGLTKVTQTGSGAKVIRMLVKEMPELRPLKQEMLDALTELKNNAAYQQSLFSRSLMPLTFGIFDETSQFSDLNGYLVGYDRQQ